MSFPPFWSYYDPSCHHVFQNCFPGSGLVTPTVHTVHKYINFSSSYNICMLLTLFPIPPSSFDICRASGILQWSSEWFFFLSFPSIILNQWESIISAYLLFFHIRNLRFEYHIEIKRLGDIFLSKEHERKARTMILHNFLRALQMTISDVLLLIAIIFKMKKVKAIKNLISRSR